MFIVISPGCQKKGGTDTVQIIPLNPVGSVDALAKWKEFTGTRPSRLEQYPEMLPAYALPGERTRALKGDESDTFRAAHPAWYKTTIPTNQVTTQFKGMVEWEPMQTLLLTVAGGSLPDEIDQDIADMAREAVLIAGVDVHMVYTSGNHRDTVSNKIYAGATGAESALLDSKLHWVYMDHGSIWMIDYGPFPITDLSNRVSFVDFEYYHERVLDDALPTRLGYEEFGINTFRMPVGFEGGNLQMDSMGTCYVTQGLLWYNSESEAELQDIFAEYLGCTQLVIVAPLADEGTTHIDMFFKLVDDHTVILGEYKPGVDGENKTLLDNNASILSSVSLPDNQPVTVHRMVMPTNNNHQVWRTHINSTFVKGPTGAVNLWPGFDDVDTDPEALAVWESVMPTWSHVRIKSDEIITWGGAMHCISRTVQAGQLQKWIPDGACQNGTCASNNPNAYGGNCNVDTGCSGPEWKGGCQGVSQQGCCDDGKLFFCEDGQLTEYNCQGACGWDSQNNFYNCGKTGEGPASYPIDCPWDQCTPNCNGKQCGDDGCGGTCGSCGLDESCNQGSCVGDPGCDGLTYEGCCTNDLKLKWCENGEVKTLECDNTCGWNPNANQPWYVCGAEGDGPPEFPISCEGECQPQCDGMQCGGDGCGGLCGSCDAGSLCQNGVCVCEPICEGVECGGDGCGGTCGTCGAGSSCDQGVCTCAPACDNAQCGDDGCGSICGNCGNGASCVEGFCIPDAGGCGNVGPAGVCQGRAKITCVDNDLDVVLCDDCCLGAPDFAAATCVPASGCPCEPDCVGKQCGDNGCGGSCGSCSPGLFCDVGTCVIDCTPDCNGKQCGADGCGGFCGGCAEGTGCLDGTCMCIPDCRFMQCGGDGCGGSCGTCLDGFACSANQTCESTGIPTDMGTGSADAGAPPGSGGGSSGCSTGSNPGSSAPLTALLTLSLGLVLRRRQKTIAQEV
jgi:agmatine/peptidylarginine deiminase